MLSFPIIVKQQKLNLVLRSTLERLLIMIKTMEIEECEFTLTTKYTYCFSLIESGSLLEGIDGLNHIIKNFEKYCLKYSSLHFKCYQQLMKAYLQIGEPAKAA